MRRVSILAWICLGSAPALAQPADNKALAEQLFAQGRDLAKANNWEAACPKFEASLKYDPTLGTRLNLATCYEKTGKLASAWGVYRESIELAKKAGDEKRRQYAASHAAALEPRLPRLTIESPAGAPAGLTVTRDGETIDAAAFGTSLFVNPGEHVVSATAPGFESFSKTVTLGEKQAETVVLPPLVKTKEPEHPPVVTTGQVEEKPVPSLPPPAPPSHARKYAGIGLAAAGVAAAGVGIVFGVKAKSTWKDAKDLCGSDLVCDNDADYARGKQLVSDARSQATLSTVLVIAGGAAAATGVVLWLTAPSGSHTERSARVTPAVTNQSAGLVLEGSF